MRAQGGSNAGHTVYNEGKKYVLHLMPSGILWPGKECVIGNGVVIDPLGFIKEIEGLEEKGIPVTPEKLRISNAAHLVFPHHRALDVAREQRRGKGKLGTTGRGTSSSTSGFARSTYLAIRVRMGLGAWAIAAHAGSPSLGRYTCPIRANASHRRSRIIISWSLLSGCRHMRLAT